MRPTFTVLIGTIGRPSLRESLESIARQALIPGDQVYVGLDARAMSQEEYKANVALVRSYNSSPSVVGAFEVYGYVGFADAEKVYPDWPQFRQPDGTPLRVPAGQPYSWLGVEQINHALRSLPISGSHLTTIGDDDIFVDGAFAALRPICALDQSRPVFYRFLSPARDLLWDRPRLRSCKISGCCILAPRQWVGLHPTDIETTHDYRWMKEIEDRARAAGKPPIWVDYLGVVARPSEPWHYGPQPFNGIVDEVEQE